MAAKRMFAKTIIDSDAFLDMPQTTQLLYFHLSMRADDDGFINNPKSIMRNVKCSEDDLKILCGKKFIIPFESGIVVIKHWKIHNYIAKDRYTETKYKDEKNQLLLDENNAYTEIKDLPYTECIQPVYEMDTQVRLGKDSIDKYSKEDIEVDKSPTPAPRKKSIKHRYGEYNNVRLTDTEKERLINELGQEIFDKCITKLDEYIQETGKKYKDHNLTIRRWVIDAVSKDKNPPTTGQPKPANNRFNNFPQRNYSEEDYQSMEEKLLSKYR